MAVWERMYVGLLHYPVYNKKNEIVTTTITNLDLHDIARTVRTYDLRRYYVINPLESQQAMVRRMQEYWKSGYGAEYNANRRQAFSRLKVSKSLFEVEEEILSESGKRPRLVVTDARTFERETGYFRLREMLREDDRPYLFLFGTGWGISRQLIAQADIILAPIYGPGEYNHLSVRSAAAIILDRLFARSWWK